MQVFMHREDSNLGTDKEIRSIKLEFILSEIWFALLSSKKSVLVPTTLFCVQQDTYKSRWYRPTMELNQAVKNSEYDRNNCSYENGSRFMKFEL